MKIQFLGTAAFEGIPAIFCDCEVCKRSMEAGGRNIRTRSQALIDDKILIDFNPDTFSHYLTYKFPISKIKTCLITHSHCDHFYVDDMLARLPYYSHPEEMPLTIYGTEPAYNEVMNRYGKYSFEEKYLDAVKVEKFVPFEVEGYRITPLAANHDPSTMPVFYIIEKDNKAMMYGHDTGYFPDETWEYLKNNPIKLDFVTLDCTETMRETRNGHMSVACDIEVHDRMKEMGLIDDNTKVVINHFSHNGQATYDDTVEYVKDKGLIVSYDGMVVEF